METNKQLNESEIRKLSTAVNAPHGNNNGTSLNRIQKLQSLLKKEDSFKELCN